MLQYIRKKILYIKSSDFIKNIATLLSGNILGYGINLVLLPIISRIYTQSALGEYDLLISSANIVLPILQLSLLLVIMIPSDEMVAKIICRIILYFTLIGSAIICCILFFLAPGFYLFKLNVPYAYGLILFSGYLILYNLQNIYYSYTNRKKLYSVLFWNPIIMSATNGILSIVLGKCNGGSSGYMIGTLASYAVAVMHMKKHVHPFQCEQSPVKIYSVLKQYKKYPLVQLPSALVSNIAIQLPAQFLGRMFSVTILSGYTMACKILSVPVSLLAVPVNRVYYRTLIEKLENGENAGEFAFTLVKNNIMMAFVPIGFLMIFGDIITGFFLGSEWAVSGVYISILGVMYLLKYCSSCMSGTFVAVGRQDLSLGFSVFTLLLYGGCFIFAYRLELGIIETMIFYAFFASLHELMNLLLCMHCLQFPITRYLKFVLKNILVGFSIVYLFCGIRYVLL